LATNLNPKLTDVMLTEEQRMLISNWAQLQHSLSEVQLYGSRHKGTAHPQSDVDLAVSIGGDDEGERLAEYIEHRDEWERELSGSLGLPVHIELADSDLADNVPRWIKEDGSTLLWKRERQP
jgi:predicted nucleotidyltransferase